LWRAHHGIAVAQLQGTLVAVAMVARVAMVLLLIVNGRSSFLERY
jgi:hypothetical protein